MRKFILILLIFNPIILLAQEEIGIKLDLGVSAISKSALNNTLNVDYSSQAGPSANLGMFYNFHISHRSMMAFEISYMRIESREVINGVLMMDGYGRMVAFGTSKIRKRISYLALPIYYGFKFPKWSINAGIQFSTVLSGSAEVQSESEFYKYNTEYDLPLNEIDYGPRIGLTWKLGERIDLESTYYHGISNIKQDQNKDSKEDIWNIQQLTFGMRYAFYKK